MQTPWSESYYGQIDEISRCIHKVSQPIGVSLFPFLHQSILTQFFDIAFQSYTFYAMDHEKPANKITAQNCNRGTKSIYFHMTRIVSAVTKGQVLKIEST